MTIARQHRPPKRTTLDLCMNVIGTDTTFMAGSQECDGLTAQNRAHHQAMAKAAGVSTSGRFCPELAEFRGDPKAWVHDRQDVKDYCERTGHGVDGMVEVQARERPPVEKKPYRVAPDIVKKEVDRIVTEEAGGHMPARERADLAEATATRLKGSHGA